ncbi:hypothetical protein AMECASPLE_037573 [Ameca splendens]|uniref:Uncharacterized protein n=1 Tax=Ameca splendens TaxID=208324 RepID=A0ABV0Z5U1_9TELE
MMGPDGLCGRKENFTLKCVESARGTTEYSCVCVCVQLCVCVGENWLNKASISRLLLMVASGAAEASWPCSGQQLSFTVFTFSLRHFSSPSYQGTEGLDHTPSTTHPLKKIF